MANGISGALEHSGSKGHLKYLSMIFAGESFNCLVAEGSALAKSQKPKGLPHLATRWEYNADSSAR